LSSQLRGSTDIISAQNKSRGIRLEGGPGVEFFQIAAMREYALPQEHGWILASVLKQMTILSQLKTQTELN
jgi:hypothetical protein